MRRLMVAFLMVGPLAGASCSAEHEPPVWRAPVADPPSGSSTPGGPAEISLAFAGDVHFAERTAPLLDEPATAFGPVVEVLAAADLAMINLETSVTTGGTAEPKTFLFRAPPETFDAVRAAGVDVVSLANNHALDYGREGLADTLDHASAAGVPVVGAGRDAAAAYAPWVTEVRGVRIAYLGFSQVWELYESWRAGDDRSGIAYAMDAGRAVEAVRETGAAADVVVAYLHWGLEGEQCPTAEMTRFAVAVAQAGADLVVGTHAHLLLGGGWLDQTYVQYGLGNFLWWRDDAYSNDTGVLWVELQGTGIESVELRPAVISRETGQPIPADGDERDRIMDKYADLRGCTGLSGVPDPG